MSGLRELAAQATPGPWGIERIQLHWNEHVYRVVGGLHSLEDARLVALAPEMAALLTDAMEELQEWADYAALDEFSLGRTPSLLARFDALNHKAAQ